MNLPYCFFRTLFLIIFKIFFRLEVIDSQNVPEKGGVIVVTNHISHLDPLVIGAAIKKRPAVFMAKLGLFRIPLIGAFVRAFSLPVNRNRPQPSTIKEAVRRLKNGELMVMFPEGGRSRHGSLLDAKRGTAMMAAMARAVIVPAYIDGTDRAFPAGSRFIRLSKIRVIFGKPIEAGETSGKDFQDKIGNDIMKEIGNLKIKMQKQKLWK